MKKEMKLEDIEGFNDLTDIEKEYFKVMQGEFEIRTSGHYSPGSLEIALSAIIFSVYVVCSILEGCMDVTTFCAGMILAADIWCLFENRVQ